MLNSKNNKIPKGWKVLIENADYLIDQEGNIYNSQTFQKLKPWVHDKSKTNHYLKLDLYNRHKNKNEKFYVHRLIMNNLIQEIPEGMLVDHINGLKFDNRVENLHLLSAQENANLWYSTQCKFQKTLQHQIPTLEEQKKYIKKVVESKTKFNQNTSKIQNIPNHLQGLIDINDLEVEEYEI
ncbi:HNH endonuclease signature motif containing protein [Williamsoniiplasma lucivorax]|uniref:HNH nuclease domain-containing protein n=1 Tax=Williamsoniiplasma lucivorax TaxID=209274 RepID=A0A2S5RDL9_9MOLU|nr:HNH endonuclease signature motif containing protein [Williamsoniiplasma lucivorax]PPE05397.1 hypothetical protein ELUCI_v1c04890 [Williamsoniiplasma lucivorax]